MNTRRLLLLVVSLMLAWQAHAQQQPEPKPENAEQQGGQQSQEEELLDTELTPEELAVAENDELVLGDDAEAEQDEEAERSSSRFIPTEQISQDLGVSFPVDI